MAKIRVVDLNQLKKLMQRYPDIFTPSRYYVVTDGETMVFVPIKSSRHLHYYEIKLHGEEYEKFKAELELLFERGEVRGVELRFVSEGKRSIPVELQAKRVTGKVAVVEARDRLEVAAWERKLAAEQARREAEHRLRPQAGPAPARSDAPREEKP